MASFTFHSAFFTFLVACVSKRSLKLKRKIILKILNYNSKYNFKPSAQILFNPLNP